MIATVLFVMALLPMDAVRLAQGEPPAQPQSTHAVVSSTQPTTTVAGSATQPAQVVVSVDAGAADDGIAEVLARTRLGQLFEGKKKVTLDEIRNPLFWMETVRDLIFAILGFIPRLIVAFLFLLFFWLIYRAVRRVVIGSMNRAKVDPSIRDMLGHLLKWVIMGFGLVIACNQVGIEIAALLTGVGIIGLAVGFAAQETLSNFIAGIVIFWDKPFKVGDWVELDGESTSTFGQVQRVTFRSTRILDLNGQLVIYPNTHMLSNRLSNHTAHPLTRVIVPIGIAYKESIDAARAALLATTRGDTRIATDPPANVVVEACADSSVNLLLRFWVRDESAERALRYEYTEKCKTALDAAGIEIPFPHMQLMIKETPAIDRLAGSPMRRAS